VSAAGRPRVWILVALLVVIHFFLHVGLSYGRAAPDLITLALLFLARETTYGRAAVFGFFFGLLEDALSVLAFGANSVAMTLLAIGGSLTRDLFMGDSRIFLVSYLVMGKWLRDLVHWIAVGPGLRQPFMEQVVIEGGVASVYIAVVGFVLAELWDVRGEA